MEQGPRIIPPEADQSRDSSVGHLVFGGLTRWAASRFADRLESRAEGHRESSPTVSPVIDNIIEHALLAGTHPEERDEDRERLVRLRHHGVNSGSLESKNTSEETEDEAHLKTYYSSLRPVSRSERRAARKADRKLRKNMRPAVVNRTYELAYNETIEGKSFKIGTPEHERMIAGERLTRAERKEAKKATRQFKRNQLVIDNRFDSTPETLDKLAARIRTKFDPEPATQQPKQVESVKAGTDTSNNTSSEIEEKPIFEFNLNQSTQSILKAVVDKSAAEEKAKKERSRKKRDEPEKTVQPHPEKARSPSGQKQTVKKDASQVPGAVDKLSELIGIVEGRKQQEPTIKVSTMSREEWAAQRKEAAKKQTGVVADPHTALKRSLSPPNYHN